MIDAQVKMDWATDKVMNAVAAAVAEANLESAEAVYRLAVANCPADEGEMRDAIELRKSKFPGGGYIVGVFGTPTPRWENSIGARAVFVEYGHAAPNAGRGKVKRSAIRKHVAARPFLRPALDASGARIVSSYHGRLR